MTDSNYTHLLAIVDRSASMGWNGAAARMTSALNEYFSEQALVEGKCLVDYYQFDTEHDLVFRDKPVAEAKAEISPRGGTALLDAIGRVSTDLGNKLRALPEHARPGNVQVVIVTDGEENSSREYTYEAVKTLILQQESKYNWDYVFLGANIDAVAVGAQFGIKAGSALTFDIASDFGTRNTTRSLSNYTTSNRVAAAAGAAGAAAFDDEDREEALANA